MGWKCSSNSRGLALQLWNPEFKLQYRQKKKQKQDLKIKILGDANIQIIEDIIVYI
jgi:hypothetical protein